MDRQRGDQAESSLLQILEASRALAERHLAREREEAAMMAAEQDDQDFPPLRLAV